MPPWLTSSIAPGFQLFSESGNDIDSSISNISKSALKSPKIATRSFFLNAAAAAAGAEKCTEADADASAVLQYTQESEGRGCLPL